MKASSRYFENHACQYYPCHEGQQEINCMFCYCPMYAYEKCLGNPSFIERDGKRIKNCTKCCYPHQAEHYDDIISFLRAHGAVRDKKGVFMKKVEDYIRSIPDFPEEGIIFRDITSILQDAKGLKLAIDEMIKLLEDVDFDVIAGTESRGFIFGVPIAYALGKPFVPIRKVGKLPCETISKTYDLEYGTATIEMHKDAITPGQKVVLVDDLIATGGTIEAAASLVEELGGEVAKIVFLMELAGLKGRDRLTKYDVAAVVTYDGK